MSPLFFTILNVYSAFNRSGEHQTSSQSTRQNVKRAILRIIMLHIIMISIYKIHFRFKT